MPKPPVLDKQGSLKSEEHLSNCIRASRNKGKGYDDDRDVAGARDRDVAGARDPAVEDGGWLDPGSCTPFGLRETTGRYAFLSMAWRNPKP